MYIPTIFGICAEFVTCVQNKDVPNKYCIIIQS